LSIAFAAVAILAVAANLLAEQGFAIVQLTEGTQSGAAGRPTSWLRQSIAVAADSVLEAIDRFDRAVEARARLNTPAGNADLAAAADGFEREMTAYLSAARVFADPIYLEELAAGAGEHRTHGANIIRDVDRRRALSAECANALDALTARLRNSLDSAWKILGRVIARQSLLDLSRTLDEIRGLSARLTAGDTYDTTVLTALTESEVRFATLLEQQARGLTRSQGKEWVANMRADFGRVVSLRETLVRLDQQKAQAAAHFVREGRELARQVRALDTSPGLRAGVRPPALAKIAALRTGIPNQAPLDASSSVATRLNEQGVMLLWISVAVLVLLLLISVSTVLSVVGPVRRFIAATRRLATGESGARMQRGGLSELDALAVAFNQMAEQISAYQSQLEAKVKERTSQLQHLAEHDPLTQLPNRRQLFAYLKDALDEARRMHGHVGLLFIDLDNFKTINDSMGHAFGDRVLQSIAHRLRETAGLLGFVARLGGDEFTVVYEQARDLEDVRAAGDALVRAFQEPLVIDGRDLLISTSVGASVYPEHAQDVEALLRAADVALFHAKASGRSQLCIFSSELLDAASAKFRIEQGLRHAAERGEFELLFQPEVAIATQSTSTVEALLRWRRPDGTYAAPGQFLAVAEESGLILDISDWVLSCAIETAAGWYHGGGAEVRVAINVSARQLLDSRFVDRVRELLEAHELPARFIDIELTENVLQTSPGTIDVLKRLRAIDIAVALDDFGTGYSSLASLEQLPLTRVKLDRSLIARIHTSARSLAIAQAITGLCRSLGLEVTAEGVERPEQLALLLTEPRMHVQGFLISEPVRHAEVLDVIRHISNRMQSLILDSTAQSNRRPQVLENDPESARTVSTDSQ